MPPPLLEIRELSVTFPGAAQPSVDGITFSLQKGEILGVLGQSGAGKTSLCRALAGRLPASARLKGQATLLGSDLLTRRTRAKRTPAPAVAFIPQEPESVLHPVIRIGNQVEEVLRACDAALSPAARRERASHMLALTGLPAAVAAAYPHQLSGGQRQRVVIAQALAANPALLIADEPTSALDVLLQMEILRLMCDLTLRLDLSLIFVTHDATLLPDFAHETLVLHRGLVVEKANTVQLFAAPQHRETQRILGAIAPLPRPTELRAGSASEAQQSPDIAAAVTALSKTYRRGRIRSFGRNRVTALDGASLKLERGTLLALVGKSGSGKSTLARCLASLESPDSGSVHIEGRPRSRVQLVWQHSALALNPRWNIGDLIAEPALIQRSFSRAECFDRAIESMRQLGLDPALAARKPWQVSGGQRQRVALARALLCQPAILILDEPFAGLDLPVQQEISAVLLDLKSSQQLTILLITHDLRRAASLADRIAVIEAGRIVEEATPSTLFFHPKHATTRQLLQASGMLN